MTPFLRRIVREHRTLLLPLVVALLANVVAYFFIVRPRGVKAAGAADRATAAALALQSAERDLVVAKQLVSGKASADEELTTFYQRVLPLDHDAAVRMTYASLPALARKSGVALSRRTSEIESERSAEQKVDTLGHLVISMILQGKYADFREFVYALESAPEFLIVDDVQLSEGSAANDLPTFVVKLSTYFKLKGNGA